MTRSRTFESKKTFKENCKDVERLLEIHEQMGGTGPGRRYGVEVLNRSAIVLICAYWEAYNEDICKEAADTMSARLADPTKLPKDVRKEIANKLKGEKDELAAWKLAGDGWKQVLRNAQEQQAARLNTPDSPRLREFFRRGLGIKDVTASWARPYLSKDKACEKIDGYIRLRGEIAHRGKADLSVQKSQCEDFLKLTKEIVDRVDKHVRRHVKAVAPSLRKSRKSTRK